MAAWNTLVEKIIAPKHKVKIGFVGKYLSLKESYKSLIEALIHAVRIWTRKSILNG